MKKKSASQSAFFNLRVLIGLFIVLAGVFLALAGLGTFSAITASSAQAQQKHAIIDIPGLPPGFDCSKIHELGIDKMESLRAGRIMIACGEAEGGSVPGSAADTATSSGTSGSSAFSRLVKNLLLTPLAYGGADVDLINHPETFPNITQSETYSLANPANPNQVLVAYNDSRGRNVSPINISGASYSSDGGLTFDRLTDPARGNQSPFPGTEGDPVALYHRPTGTWLTVWIDTLCGGGGLGGYKSTTPFDPSAASWTHFCVHSGGSDDRESGWSDTNTASPFYGRLYVSWNNFASAGPPISVTHSTDNGVTWSAAVNLPIPAGAVFVRDVQITGDKITGDVYVAGMDENGGNGCSAGCGSNRRNIIYRSTDGGVTFTNTYVGPTFVGPCRASSGYFCTMYSSPAYWRHMGWGEPAVYNQVVSLVYSAKNAGDPGDVFYIRSTDSGVTFSAPFQLNSNADPTKAQWQPNISVSDAGTLLAMWYDETPRVAASCQPSSPNTPCYQMHARKSNDNGVTWLADDTLSDVASPLPLQPDPGIVGVYVGDYDYASAILTKHVTSWADGRVAINGASQQDAFTDRELVGFAVTTTVPACNSIINTQPTQFVVNLSDAALTSSVQASDFTVNGIPANSFLLSNGNATITFTFTTTPVTTQGPQAMHIPAGAILRNSDSMPIFDFTCTFCYAITPLQVTTTVPPVGGTFSPPAPGTYMYDVNFNQPVDPASVQDSDLMITGNAGGTVTGHSVSGSTVTFTLHFNFGGSATLSIGAGSITANSCNGNAAFSGTYTVLGCPPSDHYTISQITEAIVPGTVDTGNHCDDCTTPITLPFPYTLYDQTFTSLNVDSNGTLQFVSNLSVFTNSCLPDPNSRTYIIFPYWDDLYTLNSGFGIFTSISGTAPNRIFNIEERNQYFPGTGTANFEVRLYEGQTRFDVIYGTLTNGNTSATAGVQKVTAFDQYFCNGSGGGATGAQSYILQACAPTVTDAVSRKTHGTAGPFDIEMPLTGLSGVECRSGGGTHDYSLVVTFSGNVTVTGMPQSQVVTGMGCVGSGGTCDPNGTVSVSGSIVTVPLTNIADVQVINVQINGVNGASDEPAVNVNIPMGFLTGDVNGNRAVNASDVSLTKSKVGQTVTSSNFREDVNTSGTITATDVTIVKSDVGHALSNACQFHVLIAYSDIGGPPTTLKNQIMAESGVVAVDLFDAFSGTPTLTQLQQYQIVVAFSNNVYNDPVAMGNVLADYADGGGVVVGLNFDWYGPPFGLDGRWITGGYTPFNTGPTHFATSCLGTYDMTHPLMQGIPAGSLCAFFRHTLTLSSGAVSVAMYQDNEQLCAYKTNNGHTGVGINAYLGSNPENFTGPFGHVIVNAGRWLLNCTGDMSTSDK